MVDNRLAKRMAEDAAEGVSGVKDIHNQLRIKQDQEQGQNQQGQNQQKLEQPKMQEGSRSM